jgi:hypothetical protein
LQGRHVIEAMTVQQFAPGMPNAAGSGHVAQTSLPQKWPPNRPPQREVVNPDAWQLGLIRELPMASIAGAVITGVQVARGCDLVWAIAVTGS